MGGLAAALGTLGVMAMVFGGFVSVCILVDLGTSVGSLTADRPARIYAWATGWPMWAVLLVHVLLVLVGLVLLVTAFGMWIGAKRRDE